MAQTLKEAMAERGLTVKNLADFFQVDIEQAERWINHQRRFHRKHYKMLRDRFLMIGYDEFGPIREELLSVPNDKNEYHRCWRKKFRPAQERPVRYPEMAAAIVTSSSLKLLEAISGAPVCRGRTYRKLVQWAINVNSDKIEAMKKIMGCNLDEWRKNHHKLSPGRGQIQVVVQLTTEQKNNLQWLSLANGLPVSCMLEKILHDYAELMKIQPKGATRK